LVQQRALAAQRVLQGAPCRVNHQAGFGKRFGPILHKTVCCRGSSASSSVFLFRNLPDGGFRIVWARSMRRRAKVTMSSRNAGSLNWAIGPTRSGVGTRQRSCYAGREGSVNGGRNNRRCFQRLRRTDLL
jgi:hypothetical protein